MNGSMRDTARRDSGTPDVSALYRWRWRPRARAKIYRGMRVFFHAATAWLPGMARLALRDAITVKRPLDYGGAKIEILADSWIEYDKRAASCAKEPETVAWIESHIKPGEVVYDIGANVGAYSLVMGKRFQGKVRVYAFEPSFSTFAQLCRNVFLNQLSDCVHPMYVALADTTCVSHFNYSSMDTGTALHALGPRAGFTPVHRQPILCFTLDELVERFSLDYPHHIKLDVDGIEYQILDGARRVLAHPSLKSLLVESEETRPGAGSIARLLSEAGFVLESEHVHNANPLHHGPYVRNRVYVRKQP